MGPVLVVEKVYAVSVFVFLQQVFGISFNQTELHKIADAPVTCSDARAETGEIVVGFNLNTGPEQFYKVGLTAVTRLLNLLLCYIVLIDIHCAIFVLFCAVCFVEIYCMDSKLICVLFCLQRSRQTIFQINNGI